MFGCTFIAEKNLSRLMGIGSADGLADFSIVEMEVMTTLDFQGLATEGGVDWAGEEEPVQYDPEGGLAIFSETPNSASCPHL